MAHPSHDVLSSPSVTPTSVSSTPWHSTGHTGNSLQEGQGSGQELLGLIRQFHGKSHQQMFFPNPADPSQCKHHPGAARKAAACLEKAQVAAQASQLSVLGGQQGQLLRNLKITRPCKCYGAEAVTPLCTHRKHKAMNGCQKAELD